MDDTDRLVSGKDSHSLVLGSTSANEILDVLLVMLRENPARADLWLMRFDILRTVGLKDDFASALKEAYDSKALRADLDWASVRRMWDDLTGGESPPQGIVLPKSASNSIVKATPKVRRFSDIALELAGSELGQLSRDYQQLRSRPNFLSDFARGTRDALKRPTPLHHAAALEAELGGSNRIFLKREDLHKNTPESEMAAAHAHIAVALGRKFILTGNDVDEFSLALARMAPRFGLKLTVIVGLLEMDYKTELVAQLRALGAEVDVLHSGEVKTQDPREAALRLWTRMTNTCHLALSFGTGPNPYPRMVSDFQMLLGYECELQLRARSSSRPRALVATVHSEADSIGFMLPYLKRADMELFYSEPLDATGRSVWKPSARLRAYNGAKREHAWLRASGRITHVPITDTHAREMQERVHKLEGFVISFEDARAVALAAGLCKGDAGERDIVVLVA
jgi:tryptophan synthase beta chain